MEFISKVYGKIEYNPSNLITFKDGIPGFEHLNKFILVDLKEYEPFKLLQSMENDKIGLILISPFEVMDDYEVELTDELLKELNIKKPEEVLILNTVTINSDVSKITTNLKAPIIINTNSGLGEQIIVDNNRYKIKYPIQS